jgi:hypothetical protein
VIALALAAAGDAVYVAEEGNHRVRILYRNGTVGTLTGGGASGFASGVNDGNKSFALFYLMQALAVPPAGSFGALAGVAVFVSEFGNKKLRQVWPNGTTLTLAGGGLSGKAAGTADGVGTNAGFTTPSGIVCFGGSLFVSDGTRLRAVALATGAVTTLAGTTAPGFANGAGAAAAFRGLTGTPRSRPAGRSSWRRRGTTTSALLSRRLASRAPLPAAAPRTRSTASAPPRASACRRASGTTPRARACCSRTRAAAA